MQLAASVIGFPLLELWWSESKESDNYQCTYVHADSDLITRYPGIVTGHYPERSKQHVLSPAVSVLPNIYLWNEIGYMPNICI